MHRAFATSTCARTAGCTGRRAPARLRIAAGPWTRVVDEATQQAYWWNTTTNETTWSVPEEAAALRETSNDELLLLFFDYLFSPAAKYDYPSPSTSFLDLVEAHREKIYSGCEPFYAWLHDLTEATPPGGQIISPSDGSVPVAEPEREQSTASADIAMFSETNLRWNKSVKLTRREALESIRSRLSNPALRDADPAF